MEKLTNEQALEVIKGMIEKTKEDQCYAGFYHLLWGIIVAFALAVMYILIKVESYNWIGISWAFFGVTGTVISILHSKKTFNIKGTENYPDLGINAMWIGVMISLIFVTFILPLLKAYEWSVVFVMVSLLLGTANFSTGYFLKDKLSIFSGILWWIGCVVLLLMKSYFAVMGVFVILLIVNNIIPGIYLYSQARKQNGN
jgi:hypothetical protein